MDESEKLTDLKKAYADIILNTAKEAAEKIMVSEGKSLRHQRELSTAKEGALQMLVRLKHMLDSTVSEAQKTSLSQRKKIEELEAQLEEAEDIVKDLREELQQVQHELEKVTNNKLDTIPDNRLDTTGSMSPFPCSKPETVPPYKIRSNFRDPTLENGLEMVENYEMPTTFHMTNGCFHDSEFSSMRTRSKEPELYRNCCTQRIRAFERNTYDESLSFSDKICEDGKIVDLPTVAPVDRSNIRAPVLKLCHGKRKLKYNKGKAPSKIDLLSMAKVDPFGSVSFSDDVLDWSDNISSKMNKNGKKAGKDALEIAEIMASMGVEAMEAADEACVEPCNALNMADCKKEVFDTVKELSVSPEKKESDLNDKIPIESHGNKLLKYTFRRKRRKEHLNSPNGSSSLDECMPDHSTHSGSRKSSSVTESPRENQQLARQLLCFSETKWVE